MASKTKAPALEKKESRWNKTWPYLIILIILNIFIYSRTSDYDFVNIDDGVLIYDNNLITDNSIPYSEVWQSKLFGPHYKPLTFLTWKWQYNTFGNDAGPFHTLNWLLHILNTVLLFFIGYKLFSSLFDDRKKLLMAAFLLALFFSVNPLRLESVAWATERKDVLFSLFFLASWLSYIYYIEKKKVLFVLLSAVLFLLSGLSKSMGITLVAVLFLTDIWYRRKAVAKLFIEKIPHLISFFVLIYLYGFFHSKNGEGTTNVAESTGNITTVEFIDSMPFIAQWILSASLRFILWIVHSIIPLKTSIHYEHNSVFEFFSYSIFIFPLLIIGLLYLAWKYRKKYPMIVGGFLFFAITISPVLVYSQSGQAAFMADRYTYIPSIGLFIMLVVYLSKIEMNSTRKFIATWGMALFFVLITLANIGNWQNSGTLFSNAMDVSPNSSLAALNLGQHYRVTNRIPQAIQTYTDGIARNPDAFKLYSNRAKIYFDQKNYELAKKDYEKSISINDQYVTSLAGLGSLYGMMGDYPKSKEYFDKAVEVDSSIASVFKNRALTNFLLKDFKTAASDSEHVLSLVKNERDSDFYNTMGLSYLFLEEYNKAISAFDRAIVLRSNVGEYYFNRAHTYRKLNNLQAYNRDMAQAEKLNFDLNSTHLDDFR